MNDKAQLTLEYILLFMIMLIVFSIISIPLLINSISDINDIKDTVEVKNTLISLSNDVNLVYSSGRGNIHIRSIYIPSDMKIEYKTSSGRHYLSSNVKLNDSTKEVKTEVPCKVTFKNNPSYYYTTVYNRWYYNVEVKWINVNNSSSSIDINFK